MVGLLDIGTRDINAKIETFHMGKCVVIALYSLYTIVHM